MHFGNLGISLFIYPYVGYRDTCAFFDRYLFTYALVSCKISFSLVRINRVDHMDDLPDPTDWKGTRLQELQSIDSGLRCQICKEYYLSPVITSCSHTFCSLCIRRVLASDHQCPVCRTKEQETKLRKNTAIDELADAFQKSRASLLTKANEMANRLDNEPLVPRQRHKRRRGSVDTVSIYSTSSSSSAGSTRHQRPRRAKMMMIPGTSQCPVCSRHVMTANINQHLDLCMEEDPRATETVIMPRSQHIKPPPPSNHSRQKINRNAKTPRAFEQLPKINYALHNETKLRAKLAELGIPTSGGKPLLKRRHTEWVNIWNANTDSKSPESKSTLLHRLNVWEQNLSTYSQRQPELDPMEWNHSHQQDFRALIEAARDGANRPGGGLLAQDSLTNVSDA